MFLHYIFIGLGGAIGAISRTAVGKLLPVAFWGIPLPILFVNILGCFVIGILIEVTNLQLNISDNLRYFLISGFLGGFTTFSSFALEFGLLCEKNEYVSAIIYATLSFVLRGCPRSYYPGSNLCIIRLIIDIFTQASLLNVVRS